MGDSEPGPDEPNGDRTLEMSMGAYWICDACHSLNDPRNNACYKCRVKRGEAKPQPVIPGATPGYAASEFYGTPKGDTRAEPSVVLALVVGSAIAMIGTVGWYWLEAGIHFGQGRAAWAMGVVIALAVLLGGTLGGRRRVSFILPVISFLLTLAAVGVGEYLIISASLAGPTDVLGPIQVAAPEQVAAAIGDYFTSDPLRPLLWFLALAAGWLIPWGVLVGNSPKE